MWEFMQNVFLSQSERQKPFQHSQRANPEVSKRFFQAFPIILHVLFELAALKQNQDYLVFNWPSANGFKFMRWRDESELKLEIGYERLGVIWEVESREDAIQIFRLTLPEKLNLIFWFYVACSSWVSLAKSLENFKIFKNSVETFNFTFNLLPFFVF